MSTKAKAKVAPAATTLEEKAPEAYGDVRAPISMASWIHGHTGHIELSNLAVLKPMGFHMEVNPQPGMHNWLHYGIPTPVILNGRRLKIQRVMLDFATASADAMVTAVHVWDADKRILTKDGISLSGNQPFVAFDIPGTPAVIYGIGISIGLSAGVENMDHRFYFRTVGADFV